jgi:hypothetical protein
MIIEIAGKGMRNPKIVFNDELAFTILSIGLPLQLLLIIFVVASELLFAIIPSS